MRLDHLLSKEESKGCCLLFSYQKDNDRGTASKQYGMRTFEAKPLSRVGHASVEIKTSAWEGKHSNQPFDSNVLNPVTRIFWWRCACGRHPFPYRTRWLRRRRPMVLHWRRCGRAGGRQIKKENNRRKSAEYKYRHWKVSPVGNRVEPEKNR